MKSFSEVISIILVLLSTVGVVVGTIAYRNQTEPELELLARAPEKGNWFPRTLTVKKGEVNLTIRNTDVVSHGFYMPTFDIMIREVKAGEVKEINFDADVKGEHPFYCSMWCGDYHMQMRGKLIVE